MPGIREEGMRRILRNLLLLLLIAGLIAGCYFLRFDLCLFHFLTGKNCPGCGGTRMIAAMLRGEPGEAFWYNPLLLVSSPLILLLFGDIYIRFLKTGFLNARRWQRPLLWLLGAAFFAFWIIRNLRCYPYY